MRAAVDDSPPAEEPVPTSAALRFDNDEVADTLEMSPEHLRRVLHTT